MAADILLPVCQREDADADTIHDDDEASDGDALDPDGDGKPNAEDDDSDGDGISDRIEAGDGNCETPPVDTDHDGIPDYLDLDSDGDGVPDAMDGVTDADMDGILAFRDVDSDNDGASDGDEATHGTDPSVADTDEDGFPDLVEIARERLFCESPADEACGCATSDACGIPEDDFYVVLRFGEPPTIADLTFSTALRVVDVFFLLDTTESMDDELGRIRETIAAAETGLAARIGLALPEVEIGVGQHDDFPLLGLRPRG